MVDQLFDTWPVKYEQWFQSPLGKLVKSTELTHIMGLLAPCDQDHILDVGCGTGIFTENYALAGARVTGIDLSAPMLNYARQKQALVAMLPSVADMRALPFADNCFDKTVSITALEFVADARGAVQELLRVTRKGGRLVIATLNSLSPWAQRRRRNAQKDPASVFSQVYFRSPQELTQLVDLDGEIHTAVHFDKNDPPERARDIEKRRGSAGSINGAFVIGAWTRP